MDGTKTRPNKLKELSDRQW